MKIEKWITSRIKRAPYNPRVELKKGDKEYEKIKQSIEAFGLVEPLIINDHNGFLIGGHQRLTVMEDLGWKEIPVSIVNIKDPMREKALNIALNNIAGRTDKDKLEEILAEFDDEHLKLSGMDDISNLPDTGTVPLEEKYELVITFDSEEKQKTLFEKLKQEGYQCRVLTL